MASPPIFWRLVSAAAAALLVTSLASVAAIHGDTAPAAAAAAVTVAPVVSYDFDNDSGTTVVDSSSNGYDGSWVGTPAYVDGVSGKAAYVSASGDSAGSANFVKLPLVAGETDAKSSFSYEFWIDEQSRTSYGSIVSNQDFNSCNDPGLTLYNQAAQGVLEACWGQTAGGTKEYAHGVNPSAITGDWHHVAVVVDRSANTMTFYVDGARVAQNPSGSITANTAFDSGLAFSIGGFSGSAVDYGDGHTNAYIDNFAFYDQPIGADQIAADYASVNPVNVTTDGHGSATTSSTVPAKGQTVKLTATPALGYAFDSWTVQSPAGLAVGADGSFTAPGVPVAVKANFASLAVPSSDLTYDPSDPVKPILSYDFNRDSGTTVTDASGNGYTGNWTGPASYGAGVSGSAAHVTKGHNVKLDFVDGKTDASASYSFEFWIKENSYTGDAWIFANQTGGSCTDAALGYYNDSGSNGVVTGCYGTTAVHVDLGNPPIVGGWHQLAAVIDRTAGTVTWYVDGSVAGAVTKIASTLSLRSGLPYVLGQSGAVNYSNDVDALYDDVNFYDQAISASQITADYAATNPATHYPVTVDGGGHGTGFSTPFAPAAGGAVTLSSSPATGYHFDSWAPEVPPTLAITADGTFTEPNPGLPVTVKANYAPNSYTVNFDGNGADGGSMPSQTLTYDQSTTLPSGGFTRTGYTFVGWSTTKDFPVVYPNQGTVKNLAPSGSATLYALWMPAGSHFVTATGDSHVSVRTSVDLTGFAAEGSTVMLIATPATGYGFSWQVVSPAGLKIGADGSFTMPTQDVVVKAVSAPIHYTVAFDANGASSGTMAPETFSYDQQAALTADAFARTGYGFAGWATTSDGQPTYADGQKVGNLTSTDGDKITLYAVWRRLVATGDTVAPTLSYDFNGDLADNSGGGHTGTWRGTPAYVTGFDGLAASVSNGANYVELPLLAGQTDASSSFSYEFWTWEQTRTSFGPIMSNQSFTSCGNPGLTLFNHATAGQLESCFNGGSGDSPSNPPSIIGSWHHVAVVVDRGAALETIYVDGAVEGTKVIPVTSNFTSGLAFNIGGLSGSETDTGDGFTNAYVDDLAFFDKAVPAAQVANDYQATKPSDGTLLRKTPTSVPYNAGSTVAKGFVTDTFHAAAVLTGDQVSQPISGLWNGGAVTSYTKVSGDSWLKVGKDGVVTGTAPRQRTQDAAEVTVRATDGTTTSTIKVEIQVLGAGDAPRIQTATWNVWDAGSHSEDALKKDLAIIASNGFDVIGVQEDGGQYATQLAKALGWHAYEGGQGLGVVSAFPLSKSNTVDATSEAPAAGVTAEVLGRNLRVWDGALDEEDYGPYQACFQHVTSTSALAAGEKGTTRYAQAKAVAVAIRGDVKNASRTPVIFLGDLASPSRTDWTTATASAHCGVGATDWPATDAIFDTGLIDSYREANPNPVVAPGDTWSPFQKFHDAANNPEPQDRIDYVGYAGKSLKLVGSNTLVAGWPSVTNVGTSAWTSDHAAVTSTFTLAAGGR
ncbi:LamG-like jellyroll fold domain-containing protein [Rugosimonospora acidiphila]